MPDKTKQLSSYIVGIISEIKRMELKYGSDAVLAGINEYIKNSQEEK